MYYNEITLIFYKEVIMRKLSMVLVSVIVLTAGCAGYKRAPVSELTFDCVVEAPGYTQAQLYDASMLWVASSFKSRKEVLEYNDKASGVIVGNGMVPYPGQGIEYRTRADWKVAFQIKVETKEGRYRMTFSNLRLYGPPSLGSPQGVDEPVTQQADIDKIKPALLALGDDLRSSLEKTRKSENW
jgi:hypothetical protein